MELSFKSLPPKLFSSLKKEPSSAENADHPKPSPLGVLWMPPLGTHPITEKLDWLSGMQISNLQHSRPTRWSEALKENITKLELPLDEQPPFNHSNTLLFSLPSGFKSSLGLILLDADWSNREDVYKKYASVCSSFKSKFFVQSFDFWPSPEIEKIDWIKV